MHDVYAAFGFVVGASLGAIVTYAVMHYFVGCRKHPITDEPAIQPEPAPAQDHDELIELYQAATLYDLMNLMELHELARIPAEATLRYIREATKVRLTTLAAKHPEELLRSAPSAPNESVFTGLL